MATYHSIIHKALTRLGTNGTKPPEDKSNTGPLLAEAFLWDEVKRYAEARSKSAWARLTDEQLVPAKADLEPGEHHLCESQHFAITAKASEPVKRFNADILAENMHKRFKVAIPTAKEMIEAAKVPTKPTVSMRVVEKSK